MIDMKIYKVTYSIYDDIMEDYVIADDYKGSIDAVVENLNIKSHDIKKIEIVNNDPTVLRSTIKLIQKTGVKEVLQYIQSCIDNGYKLDEIPQNVLYIFGDDKID